MKAYKVIKSNIHRKGLCAARNIKRGERIIEYRGKKLPTSRQMKVLSMAMILLIYLYLIKNIFWMEILNLIKLD